MMTDSDDDYNPLSLPQMILYGAISLVLALFIFYLYVRVENWRFRECLKVGHTPEYCAVDYPFGNK